MSAASITAAIYAGRWRRNMLMTNYYPRGWWECDVFELTPGGSFREYEIKLTRSDFLADRNKKREDRWRYEGAVRVEIPGEYKHDLLAAGCPRGPQQFWYVTRPGLLTPDDLPKWAGLIEVKEGTYYLTEVVKAPRLHREPFKHRTDVLENCYFRLCEVVTTNLFRGLTIPAMAQLSCDLDELLTAGINHPQEATPCPS